MNTHPSQEAVEVDDFEVLICEVTKQLHVGTINAYEANKKLIGAYNKVRATYAQTIRDENDVARLEWFRSLLIKMRVNFTDSEKGVIGALEDEIQKAYQALTPTTNHTGETNP